MVERHGNWEILAKTKRDSVNNLIPEEWKIYPIPSVVQQCDVTGAFICKTLSQEEVDITEADASEILKNTCAGRWKAETVVRAFCHRASVAHQLTNCLHEICFELAIETAKKLDNYYATHKAPIGPLHGLPISLKDQFHVKGVETTMGYVGWIGTFQGKRGTGMEKIFESEMVQELRQMGAVFYCKTSVPHTLMSGETINNIIGYTWNPKNRNLSAGGSSGGEGALISLKGSPVGFGTDIGGSVRIPAAFNGLYGLRPSGGRLPYEGMANSMDGQNSVVSVVGPIAHSVATLRLLVKAILSQDPWLHDPLVHEIPWRDDQEREILDLISSSPSGAPKLAFGIMEHDGVVTPQPPVQRAIDIVTKSLERSGHKAIEWKPPGHERGNEILSKVWMYDGGTDIHKAFGLSGEPISPQVTALYGTEPIGEMNATAIAANNLAKREYQKEYMEYWNSTEKITGTGRPVDAFITAVAPYAAARPGMYRYLGYSKFVNVLDYPACIVPVTTVDPMVDLKDENYQPRNKEDKHVADNYDPAIFDGAHVAVQLIGRRLQEEKVLALAEHIGNAIHQLMGADHSIPKL